MCRITEAKLSLLQISCQFLPVKSLQSLAALAGQSSLALMTVCLFSTLTMERQVKMRWMRMHGPVTPGLGSE